MAKQQILTIEKFNAGEESKYLIRSAMEIQLTLQAIAKNRTPVLMYYEHEQHFLRSILLCANDKGIWLDVSKSDADNNALVRSDEVILVTMHQGAKVQFACPAVIIATYAANPAYYFPLPTEIFRVQRREYFRLSTTADAPLSCVVPPKEGHSESVSEVTIMDISVGGIALMCRESSVNLQEGQLYEDCRIDLPGVGTLVATVMVKNLFDVTTPAGKIIKHAGCEFVQMDGKMTMLLQRYIGIMQSRIIATK